MHGIHQVSLRKGVCQLAIASGFIFGIMAVGIPVDATAAVPGKLKRECRADYKSLCPRYKVGTPSMRSCMRSKGRELSWGCYQSLKDHGYVKGR